MVGSDTIIDQRMELIRQAWKRRPRTLLPMVSKPAVRQPLAIAISREAGAPGVEIGEEVSRRIGYPIYDRQILELIGERVGLRAELLQTLDERDPNWLVEALGSFGNSVEKHRAAFLHHLIQVIAALAAQGDCIIVGRGAAALLPRNKALKVRVVADLKDRVERSARKFNLSLDDAAHRVRQVDLERRQFVEKHFHRDVNDPHNFDLVLNASLVDVPTCAALIIEAAKARTGA